MIKHEDSHLDHGLTADQVAHIFARFADRSEFFIETFELPEELGTVPCGLYGPAMGDQPIVVAFRQRRGTRQHESRLVAAPTRPTRTVTVIAGPHADLPCVLFTAFGGPLTPKEDADPTLRDDERAASEAFWSEHALASP